MRTFKTILFTQEGPVATITLNRPDVRNAMSHRMAEELLRCVTTLATDPAYAETRVLVLRGAGKSFCAGGDVHDMVSISPPEDERATVGRLDELLRAVNEAPQVVIARVRGHALGGGFGLVCVSDIAIAGYSASFGLPEVRLGLVPSIISPYVVERIGFTCARRLMLTGGQLNTHKALALGVVQEVCADMELDARLQAVINEVLLCAPHALRECKRLLFQVARQPAEHSLDYRIDLLNRLRTSEEAQQGITAFLTKQPPPWAPTS